jgi:hypothetical protein
MSMDADESGQAEAPRGEDQCSFALGRWTIGAAILLVAAAVMAPVMNHELSFFLCGLLLLLFAAIYGGLGIGAYRLAKKQQGEQT